ncbi:MAG: phospho-sugar mutase [Oscillospiraceae bacterium]|nr:phospho-sugar mutase [Oscillospiraceae bacterium]
MSTKEKYLSWRKNVLDDLDLVSELKNFNEDDINRRFSLNLNFGTAGLRGIMGAGTDRVNIYTVRLVTQSLCNFLRKNYEGNLSVVVAFDSRNKSKIFATETARVFCANSIRVFFNKELKPTPVLSYCVRKFNCNAGVMITASHNPPEYNGYKCYGPDGSQLTDLFALAVYNEIEKIDIFDDVRVINSDDIYRSDFFEIVNSSIYEKYISEVKKQCLNKNLLRETDLKVVYTPLNGCGREFVIKILSDLGLKNLFVVKEQENPDGEFKSCKIPNPELEEAFNFAVLLAREKEADVIIATDPDSDRVGVKARHEGDYITVTGNQIGVLILDYILTLRRKNAQLPDNPIVLKSITSTLMVDAIAKKNFCQVIDVLTGFKNIGEKILRLEKSNKKEDFIFAFEESCGYLMGTYVRDKDGIAASVFICEMAAYYKKMGITLIDKINSLYDEYGYYCEKTLNFDFNDVNSAKELQDAMKKIRSLPLKEFKKVKILRKIDLLKDKLTNLPKSDVIILELDDSSRIIVRPSGTESKIKVYILLSGRIHKNATNFMKDVETWIKNILAI